MTTFDELIRYRNRQLNRNRFNIIGFNSNFEPKQFKHCIFCIGRRLKPDPYDESKLLCFSCGYSVLAQDAANKENISVKHEKQQSAIISAKNKNKKYYDKSGNLITDPDLIAEIQKGANVISYRETVLQGQDTVIDSRNRRIV